jgi:hypothetical protein
MFLTWVEILLIYVLSLNHQRIQTLLLWGHVSPWQSGKKFSITEAISLEVWPAHLKCEKELPKAFGSATGGYSFAQSAGQCASNIWPAPVIHVRTMKVTTRLLVDIIFDDSSLLLSRYVEWTNSPTRFVTQQLRFRTVDSSSVSHRHISHTSSYRRNILKYIETNK